MAVAMLISRWLCLGLVPVAFALVFGLSPSDAARTWPAPVPIGADFSGLARVIDGDTLEVAGVRVRLEGIDAPEQAQSCKRADGGEWACGHAATAAMQQMAEGRAVTCRNHGLEKYGRTLGTCFANGKNVNAELVKMGLAWAFVRYSSTYIAEEQTAHRAHLGIWQAPTMTAWDYRAQAWTAHAEQAPNGCAIKGNVTANGNIYHMPWSPWYDKVRITGHSGKRWFCSEAEAVAAGWRPAYVRGLSGRAAADVAAVPEE
jgi:endonuclease YncB( thermonuclease family)